MACKKNGKEEEDEWGQGERTADGFAEKGVKIGGNWVQGEGKEEDEWCKERERTAEGFVEKRAKMRGIATQWWRVSQTVTKQGRFHSMRTIDS